MGRLTEHAAPVVAPAAAVAPPVTRPVVQVSRCPGVAPGPDGSCPCHDEVDHRVPMQGSWSAAAAQARPEADSGVRAVTDRAGSPLPGPVRADMERRFGAGFADVRIHTDAAAAESANSLQAHAYTTGSHIVFERGGFAPGTGAGRRTLAHELSHVLQQRRGPVAGTPLSGGLTLSTPGDSFERAADATAAAALARPAASHPTGEHHPPGGDLGPRPDGIQRQESAPPETPSAPPLVPASVVSASADAVDDATARLMVDDAIRLLSPQGATLRPFPPLVAAAEPPVSAPVQTSPVASVQRTPTIQRAGGGGWKPTGGVVTSLQLCYDLCKQQLSLVGWVWAGAGVSGPGLFGAESFYGAFLFAEKDFGKTTLEWGPKLSCGACATTKPGEHEESFEWGAGIAGFPFIVKPNDNVKIKGLGVEIGALLMPHPSTASATFEVIVLLDVTQFLGPPGQAFKRAQDWINIWAPRIGVEVECGVGAAFSGLIHLCHSVPGGGLFGVTADSAELCGGPYVGCDINLSHSKAALPH